MDPRKKDSKKWTKIPADYAIQIQKVFEQNFKAQLVGKHLKFDGRLYPSEIVLRVDIHTQGELRHHNFEVSLDHSKEKQNAIPQIHVGVDALASVVAEYFETDNWADLPLIWQAFPFEKQTIWLKYTGENPDLEAEANRLLGLESSEALLTDLEDLDLDEEQLEALIEKNNADKATKKQKKTTDDSDFH